MQGRCVLMLEDDPARVVRVRRVLHQIDSETKAAIWASTHEMVRDLSVRLPGAVLVSPDHDLIEIDHKDSGDGLLVARILASMAPSCHVIVHTSNNERGRAMMGELELGGWTCSRVLPIGDDWIENDWANEVRTRLA